MSTRSERRRPLAAHGRLRTRGPLAQILKLIGVVVAVLLVSGAGVAAYVAAAFTGTIAANSVELENQKAVPPDIGAYEEGFDLLLVGLDQCEEKYKHLFGARCEGKEDDPPLNDVNLLVHVSEEPRRVTAVSLPRDLMVDSPECTDAAGGTSAARGIQPLNSAWEHGGLSCVAKTVEALSGQDIEFAAAVTFGGVIEITNAIGGVEVCLATGIRDSETGLDLPPGTHTIEGYQALQFLRTRYGVGDGSDTGRIGNQQQYLSSLARTLVSSEVLGDAPTMLKLANTALSNLQTSTSLSENPMTIAQIALALKDIDFADIVFVQYPNGSSAAYPNKVVPKYDAAEVLWNAINANQPLEITHENGSADGVVVQGDVEGGSTEAAPAETSGPAPAPTETAVALPDSISGSTAAQQTCSNGNMR